jgi:hypothetical protein
LSGAVERIVQSAPVRTWKQGVDIAGGYSPTAGAVLATVPTAIGVAAGAKPALKAGRATSNALNKVGQFLPTKNGAAALGRQKGMIDIWSDLLDADKKGGREAAKQRAIQLIQENPEFEANVINNYQDLGYSDLRLPEIGFSDKKQANTIIEEKNIQNNNDFYHRFTATKDSPVTYANYAMFADDYDGVSNAYGAHHWQIPKKHIDGLAIDASSDEFKKIMKNYLDENEHFIRYSGYDNIDNLLDSANPDKIVDSAGFWDEPDIAKDFIDELQRKGIKAIRTNDGVILIDDAMAEYNGKSR